MTRETFSMRIARLSAWIAACAIAGCATPPRSDHASYHDPHPLPADTLTVSAAEVGHYGGRFLIAVTSDPKTFCRLMANDQASNEVNDQMFAGLSEFDNETQRVYPQLAKSWEASADGRTWTWHLRHGVCFSDGHPITSADVLFMFELAYDQVLHPSLQDLLQVDGQPFEVSAPDSYTVVMKTAGRHALMAIAVGALRIMPRHVLEPAYRAGRFASAYGVATPPDSVVTSGPFHLKQYVPGEKVVLERNPYWMGVDVRGQRLPYLDELVYSIVPDQNTAALKFQAGEVDALDNVKPEDYKTYIDGAGSGGYTLHDLGPSLSSNFLWFNMARVHEAKPKKRIGAPEVDPVKYRWFANRDFRRAVSMAIDRDALIRGPFYGHAVKNWSSPTVASKEWGSHGLTGLDYDLAGANRILDSLGYRDRNGDGTREDDRGHTLRFTVITNSDNAVRIAMLNLIHDDLRAIGIDAVPAPVEMATLTSNIRQNFNYECALLGLGSAVPPDPVMYANFVTSKGVSHYWNPRQIAPESAAEVRLDAQFQTLVASTNADERLAIWREIVRIINDECFVIWLPTQRMMVPIRNGFGNIHPTVIPQRVLWNIDRVFVKTKPPSRVT